MTTATPLMNFKKFLRDDFKIGDDSTPLISRLTAARIPIVNYGINLGCREDQAMTVYLLWCQEQGNNVGVSVQIKDGMLRIPFKHTPK